MCENLVELAKDGNSIAFDQLIAQHQGRVYALAYRILGNPDDAADVQQETFVRAWQHLRKFRQDASFSTWLHRITVNLCLSMKRRKDYAVHEQWDENVHTPDSGTACPEQTEAVIALRTVLAAMPGHHRVLIVLRDMEERPFEEIADILGCSVVSARTRLCKARSLLRERMRPYLEDNHEE